MTQTRIISLGEIVTINIPNGVKAIAEAIINKKSHTEKKDELKDIPISPEELKPVFLAIVSVTNRLNDQIEAFKVGELSEPDFDAKMIAELKKDTGVELTVDEFNKGWAQINPPYRDYAAQLEEVIVYNRSPNKKVIFVSFSNPKDIGFLLRELRTNKVPYVTNDEGHLIEINGIRVELTFVRKQRKAELITGVIADLRKPSKFTTTPTTPSVTAFTALGAEVKLESSIKYIFGTNKIAEELVAQKSAFEKDSEEARKAAEALQVDTILWDKKQTSFATLSNNDAAFCRPRLISAL